MDTKSRQRTKEKARGVKGFVELLFNDAAVIKHEKYNNRLLIIKILPF